MTQEEWNNAARNSMFARMQNGAYPRRSINNGYSTAPPTYNPYSVQFRRSDYNQPMQRYQTPPINQALTLTPQNQSEYVQTTNAYGQPVRVPVNAGSQLSDYLPSPADVLQWGGEQLVQNLAVKGLTGDSVSGWGQRALNWVAPRAAGAVLSWNIPQVNAMVNGVRSLAEIPAAQAVGRGIKKVSDWIW